MSAVQELVTAPPRPSDTVVMTAADHPTTELPRIPSEPRTERLPLLDLLRAISAHLIVWHHLAFYGPLSDVVAPYFASISEFLIDHGRNAVQVFLVIGGFVTAQSLGKRKELGLHDAARIVRRRYVRIAGPYVSVLLIAIAANWLADRWMDHHSISAFPTVPQFLAHTVFLHDILGYEALSAGVWYLAIDFQLALLVLAVGWLAHRAASAIGISPLIVLQCFIWPLAALSLYWFNRDPNWDMWAVFFFGSYAFGLITAWALSRGLPAWTFWLYAGLMAIALTVEYRPRLAVSLATGAVIFAAGCIGWLATWPKNRWIAFAGASSYSLFLIHFPVCLVVNAWLSRYVLDSPALSLAGLFAAYVLSILASIAFYYGVERMFQRERPAVAT